MDANLDGHLRHWASWLPDGIALRYEGRSITWAELDRMADELAAGLAEHGVGHGDVVALLMGNRPEFLEVAMATLRLGAILAPLNVRHTAAEIAHPVADSGTRLVITEPALLDKLEQARAADPDLTLVTADPDGGLLLLDSLRRPGATPPRVEIAADDGAFLCYTSGTTGFAKGALLSHGGVRNGGVGRVVPDGITWRDTQLLPGALAFTGGIVSCFCQITLISGATLVLERDFDPTRCLDLIARERITVLNLVPPILQFLADLPEFDTADLSSVWSVSSGGSSLSAPLVRRWQERGVRISQAYGLTEACGGVSLLGPDQALTKIGSAGRPMPHLEVRIVDDEDNDLPVGEVGEIIVRGPTLMKEYWRQPEATAHALRGGWLHTGDLGTLDADGFLTMVDRKKDMIISGAINVYPAEIERALAGVPGLGEFAVIGVPDPKWGEVPMIVVGSAALPDLEALFTRCKTELADYKRPRYLLAHGGPLPRNMAAKLLKRELRDTYAEIPPTAHRLG